MAPVFRSASIAICLPGMASSVKRAVTSDTRSEPLLITIIWININTTKMITPTIRLPPPTKSPNVATTLPAYPFNRILRVDPTFRDRRNSVVISRIVGNADICNASLENSAVKRMISARLIFNRIKKSSKSVGIGMIKKITGTSMYNPSNKSDLCIVVVLLFCLYKALPCGEQIIIH